MMYVACGFVCVTVLGVAKVGHVVRDKVGASWIKAELELELHTLELLNK